MTTLIHKILTSAALGAALFAVGCGSTPRGASGYLSDYSRLEKNPDAADDSGAKRWVAPGDVMLDYDRLLIETYSLQPKTGSFLAEIDRGNARELVDELRKRMIAVVDPYYSVVDQPGEGVLRLRVAVTDLGFGAGDREPENATSISFEAEMLDSRTGEQMAVAIRTTTVQDQGNAYDALANGLLEFMNKRHGLGE
jgi:hypothetical protein